MSNWSQLVNLTRDDLTDGFLKLLQDGSNWPKTIDSNMTRTLSLFMPTIVRTIQGAFDLLADCFPATTTDSLPEWEASLGLPDTCLDTSQLSNSIRQQMVVAKFAQSGSASIHEILTYAKNLGYTIYIKENKQYSFGDSFEEPFYDDNWVYTWNVLASADYYSILTFEEPFDLPFISWGNSSLVCELKNMTPAYTIALFVYGPTFDYAVFDTDTFADTTGYYSLP